MIDLQEPRLALGRALGAQTLRVDERRRGGAPPRATGPAPGGPPVVVDATGVPAAVRAMVDMVASAGRAVQVGMSTATRCRCGSAA